MDNLFRKAENYKAPSTILYRSIEFKFLKKIVMKYLGKRPVLDLGCGEGIASVSILKLPVDFGLDTDAYFAKQADEGKIYKKVIFANAKNIPLKDASVNLVFSNSVIEHIADVNKVIREVARILKTDGYFIFTAPSDNFKKYNVFSWLKINWLAKNYGEKREKKFNHFHCYSIKKWSKILDKEKLVLFKGYYYLNKETIEFWDFLLILFYLISKINTGFGDYLYAKFFRKRIFQRFITSKEENSKGAAICVLARKCRVIVNS